jgi:hypothetical protein
MKELLGRLIKEIKMNDDKTVVRFITDQGDLVYLVDADCCSDGWISGITNIEALIGGIVSRVNERDCVADKARR